MHTKTHAIAGMTLVTSLLPHEISLAWVVGVTACIGGAIAPDASKAIELVLDRRAGVEPFSRTSRAHWEWCEFAHSLVTSGFFLLLSLLTAPHLPPLHGTFLIFGTLGWLSHTVIDSLTHTQDPKKGFVCESYLYPFNKLPSAPRLEIARWDYRIANADFTLKPFESLFAEVCVWITVVNLVIVSMNWVKSVFLT